MCFKYATAGLLVLCELCLALQGTRSLNMSTPIDVTVRGSDRPSFLHGPVPVTITVRNVSAEPVSILLAYPVAEGLRFESRSPSIAAPKGVASQTMTRTVPIRLASNAQHSAVYYLNRYLDFRAAGTATIAWRIIVPVTTPSGSTTMPEYEGTLHIELVIPREEQIRDELNRFRLQLHDKDRQIKSQATEALAFLDTELSAEYVVDMLSIDNLQVIGIHALGRSSSRKYDSRVLQMLSHKDSEVVAAALEYIDAHRIPLPRSNVQRLLAADNPNVQWRAIGWLAQRPNVEDLPLVSPLMESSNQAVRQRATSYIQALK
jgi:hypothetical protein